MGYSTINNEELIQLARKGNDEAKEYFFKRNVKFAYSIAHKFIKTHRDKNDNDDILSESVIGLTKAFNSFDCGKGYKFTTYAGTVIQNTILMFLRKCKKSNKISTVNLQSVVYKDIDGSEITMEDVISSDLVSNDIYAICNESIDEFYNTSSDTEKRIYELIIEKDKGQCEVADMLGLSQAHVSRTLKRVKHKLSS